MIKSKWIDFFIAGLSAKIKTEHGRLNLIFDLILAVIALVYVGGDVLKNLIFATLSAFKTWALHQDIQYAYNETSFLMLIAPCVLTTLFCLIFLSVHENKKKSVSGN